MKRFYVALVLPVALGGVMVSSSARSLDVELYAKVLEQHTIAVTDIASTRVDYHALRDADDWAVLVKSLEGTDPSRLSSRSERLAFWINAYNILAIDVVRRSYPVGSIRSIGSLLTPVWKREAGRIAGRVYTLDEIEHEILRKMGEPRMHAAIVCASLSCPPLRREPYRAAVLDAQLEDNVRRWLADPRKGVRIDRAAGSVTLSPILDWFSSDFEKGVMPFVIAHVASDDADWLRSRGSALRIEYFDYDWSLNDTRTSR